MNVLTCIHIRWKYLALKLVLNVKKCSKLSAFDIEAVNPQPNDSNISTQHIPRLLAHHLQAPVKRSQQLCGRNMLHAFGQPVAICCELKIEQMRMPRRNIVARAWPNDHNTMQHLQMGPLQFTITWYKRPPCWRANRPLGPPKQKNI